MKRLFFALWPEEHVRQQIDQLNQQIKLDTIRRHPPYNLHVTLVFLGNINAEMETLLKNKVTQINMPEFQCGFDQLEFWSSPRVLCLTPSKPPETLFQLVEKLTENAVDVGVRLDKRPYQPHITLARKVKTAYQMEFEAIDWFATDFVLAESRSSPLGVKYDVLARWPLAQNGQADFLDR